jgi:hypothetical protein
MPGKIKAVKIIFQILAWLSLVGGILGGIIFMVGGGAVGASGEEGAGILAGAGILYIIIGIIGFILYFLTAKGIANKKNYGKILAIILSILMIPGPLLILGIILLVLIFNEDSKSWFEGTVTKTASPTEPEPE